MNKKWRDENKDKLRENMKNYRDRYPLVNIWRSMLHRTLKYLGQIKEGHTIDLLEYSPLQLKEHLDKQLKEDMNLDNYGQLWEIDHIRPLTNFPKDSHPCEVNALENLQPLYKIENIRKYNHY